MRTRSTPRAVAVRLAASEPGRPVLLSRFSLTATPSRLDEVWRAAQLVRTHPSRRRSPRRPPSLSRNRLTGRHIKTKTLTTTTPRERPTSHGKCTHHLTLTPALLPAPSILLPLTDGDIPRSRVHAAPAETICASGDRIPVPDGVERPRPHRNVPDDVERPHSGRVVPWAGDTHRPCDVCRHTTGPSPLVRRHRQPARHHHIHYSADSNRRHGQFSSLHFPTTHHPDRATAPQHPDNTPGTSHPLRRAASPHE